MATAFIPKYLIFGDSIFNSDAFGGFINMQNSDIVVSICCFTYNHAPFIRQCLDGFIMQQTTFPIEILIHDDASTDDTAVIIREYEANYPELIKPIYQTENQYSKGVYVSQYNFSRTQGKYIAFCEGDDYWTDPYKLQKQVDFLESNPDYGICYTKVKEYSQKQKRFLRRTWGAPVSLKALIIGNVVPTLTICARTELILKYIEEIKPETKDWKIGDCPLLIWFIQNSKIYFIDEFSGVYRILVNSAVHKTSFEESIKVTHDSYDIRLFFVNLYNLSEFKNIIDDYRNLSLAAHAIKFKKYSLYSEYISKVKGTTLKRKIKKIIGKSKLLIIIYHYYMRFLHII
jgi:glycosyltransferase involved in cell wall biosynthesis